MKHLVTLLIALLITPLSIRAQVKIGDNLANINANSILELESTTKALLLPRLNQTQIDAMQNVPAGMLVYNSTTNVLNIRTNTGWTTLALAMNAASATNPWSTTGNSIYTNSSRVGIGTNNPFSQLSNNSGNTSGSDGFGGNGNSLSWSASQQGYVGQIYNSGTDAYNNGLVVKVNSTDATALDVSKGNQNTPGAPLLTVKSSGKVGINNANPSVALDVTGVIQADQFKLGMQYLYSDTSLDGNAYYELKLGCPTGTQLIGGGGGHRDYNGAVYDINIRYSGPDLTNSSTVWRMVVSNSSSSKRAVRVYIICGKVL